MRQGRTRCTDLDTACTSCMHKNQISWLTDMSLRHSRTHAHIYARTHLHIHTYIHSHMHTNRNVPTQMHTYARAHTLAHISTCAHLLCKRRLLCVRLPGGSGKALRAAEGSACCRPCLCFHAATLSAGQFVLVCEACEVWVGEGDELLTRFTCKLWMGYKVAFGACSNI